MKRLLISLTLLAAIFSLQTSAVFADYGQYGQYGQPSPSQSILIDKFVGKPDGAVTKGGVATVQYVDNLTPSDVRFKPGNEVLFRLKVKNTSSVTLSNVVVKDFVPAYVEPIEGPGTYDANTRVISFDAGSFAPNEEKTYDMKMQLVAQDKMPSDKGLFCLTNKGQAYNEAVSDEDTAQFCVEKEVIGVAEAPKAGPEDAMLLVGAQTILMGIGFSLKKLAKNK
ncbi:MAG: hypothetical protein WC489_06540 [Patescibacteria group bacterium]